MWNEMKARQPCGDGYAALYYVNSDGLNDRVNMKIKSINFKTKKPPKTSC